MKLNDETSCSHFKWGGKGLGGGGKGEKGEDLINIQYKAIWNCHNESPLYNR
jgi:hypothetical protein